MLTLTSMLFRGPGNITGFLNFWSPHPSWEYSKTRQPMPINTSNAYCVAHCVTVLHTV